MPKETLTPDQAQEGSDLPEPTHSETRPRQAGDARVERAHRTSVRPSAFGLPRAAYSSAPPPSSEPPPAPDATPTGPSPRAAAQPSSPPPAARRPAPLAQDDEEGETRPSRRLQNERSKVIDQLTEEGAGAAAINATASEPHAAPVRVASQPSPPRTRRPWASVALFSGMLALSVVPLLRYALSREQPAPRTAAPALPGGPVIAGMAPRTAGQVARAASVAPGAAAPEAGREQQIITLIAAGNRALEAGAIADAERLFGRVIELDEDNPRAAYGLARVRLSQGNLSGAEGWIQLALRKRPRRRAYHALYAEVLMRLGRADEAHEEERQATLKEPSGESDERANAQADAP